MIAGLIYQATGFGGLDVFSGAWSGAVSAPGALLSTVRWTLPLVLVALGVLLCFRAGFFNIGAQGQMYAGAITALATVLWLRGSPTFVAIPTALAASMVGGAAWALLPGYLRTRFMMNEVVTTLMMNFIGILLLSFVTSGPFKDPTGSAQVSASVPVPTSFRLSDNSGVSLPLIIIVVVVVVVTWTIVGHTRLGLRITLAGRNPVMARWQGIDVKQLGLITFTWGGALAGLAGFIELFGASGRLNDGFSPNLGFSAVLVALVAVLGVPAAVATALFFGGLQSAIIYLPIVTNLPSSALGVLQGIVALLITVRRVPLPSSLLRAVVARFRMSRA